LPEHAEGGIETTYTPPPRLATQGTETLLLVEDEEKVLAIARRMLEGQGYRVLAASGAANALALADGFAEPIDLLITDVIMPEVSGRQLAEALLQRRPQTRVLYVSGYTDNTISHHGVLDGNVAFLQKPFSQQSLAAKVRQVLDE
jgi:CheY-like chemotaxis protein